MILNNFFEITPEPPEIFFNVDYFPKTIESTPILIREISRLFDSLDFSANDLLEAENSQVTSKTPNNDQFS